MEDSKLNQTYFINRHDYLLPPPHVHSSAIPFTPLRRHLTFWNQTDNHELCQETASCSSLTRRGDNSLLANKVMVQNRIIQEITFEGDFNIVWHPLRCSCSGAVQNTLPSLAFLNCWGNPSSNVGPLKNPHPVKKKSQIQFFDYFYIQYCSFYAKSTWLGAKIHDWAMAAEITSPELQSVEVLKHQTRLASDSPSPQFCILYLLPSGRGTVCPLLHFHWLYYANHH